MKEETKQKLILKKETLANLNETDLSKVKGGGLTTGTRCCGSMDCFD